MKLTILFALTLAATLGLSLRGFAQQTVTADPYMAALRTHTKTIGTGKAVTLDFFIMDSTSMAPSKNLTLAAALSMPSMARMTMEQPKVSPGDKPGHYNVQLTFPQAGDYKLDLTVTPATGKPTTLSFKITPGSATVGGSMGGMKGMQGMQGMEGMQMKGALGPSANREGSGTSWVPDSSPMFMKMLPSVGGFDVGMMGSIQSGYVSDGGKRGANGSFTDTMIMLMGQRSLGGGTFGLDFMSSLDPIIDGRKGVPNLFETGGENHGLPLQDHKDPHNIFAEIAASYSHPLSKDWSGFIYGGPVGEPALGGAMYLHRASGLEIPEAPISHDWFDGTHISFGDATLGLVYHNKWKVEGSWFNGADPNKNLFGVGPLALNSASGRISYNPSSDWAFSASYGYLNSEGITHQVDISAAYSHNFSNSDNLSATAYFGQQIVAGTPNSNAWLAEATYYHAKNAFFVRYERVDKNNLVNVPAGSYTINKLLVGDVHNFYSKDQLDYGIGAYAGVYSFPSSLNPSYGKSPFTFGVFFRIRPSKM